MPTDTVRTRILIRRARRQDAIYAITDYAEWSSGQPPFSLPPDILDEQRDFVLELAIKRLARLRHETTLQNVTVAGRDLREIAAHLDAGDKAVLDEISPEEWDDIMELRDGLAEKDRPGLRKLEQYLVEELANRQASRYGRITQGPGRRRRR